MQAAAEEAPVFITKKGLKNLRKKEAEEERRAQEEADDNDDDIDGDGEWVAPKPKAKRVKLEKPPASSSSSSSAAAAAAATGGGSSTSDAENALLRAQLAKMQAEMAELKKGAGGGAAGGGAGSSSSGSSSSSSSGSSSSSAAAAAGTGDGKSASGRAELKTNASGESYFEVGGMKRVSIGAYKGKMRVDVREYYSDKSTGEAKPGSKGCSLPVDTFKRVAGLAGRVDGLVTAFATDTLKPYLDGLKAWYFYLHLLLILFL